MKFLQSLILFFIPISIFSQTEWNKYDIDNFGVIEIPSSMELQQGKYKEFNDKFSEIHGIEGSSIVFQQGGLNEFEENSFKTYARILINTEKNDNSVNLPSTKPTYSKEDLIELSAYLQQEMENSLSSINIKLIEWYPLKITKIGDYYSIHISYLRQLGQNPLVKVDMYTIENVGKYHQITMSYRIENEDEWLDKYNKVLTSILLD